jgi:hypothetical protein
MPRLAAACVLIVALGATAGGVAAALTNPDGTEVAAGAPGNGDGKNAEGSGPTGDAGPTTTAGGKPKATEPTTPGSTAPDGQQSGGPIVTGSVGTTAPDPNLEIDPQVQTAYTEAYRAECNRIWAKAGSDGLLWDADALDAGGYTINECLGSLDPGDAWFYDTVEDARIGGAQTATEAAQGLTIGNLMQPTNGTPFAV